jgi:hypothetical protein
VNRNSLCGGILLSAYGKLRPIIYKAHLSNVPLGIFDEIDNINDMSDRNKDFDYTLLSKDFAAAHLAGPQNLACKHYRL